MLREHTAPDGALLGFTSELLRDCGVPHLFSASPAGSALGVTPPAGRPPGDACPALLARLAAALGRPGAPVASLHQVHGPRVLHVDELAGADERGDGLCSDAVDHLVAVRTADCVPLLLAAEDGRAVAAVHAGWRGLLAGVVEAGVARLRERTDAGLVAALGPCLSEAAFEVGPEVAEAFAAAGLDACVHPRPGARPHVDLRAAVVARLAQHGVTRVDAAPPCTVADPRLFSYRWDVTHGGAERTGRLVGLVGPAG